MLDYFLISRSISPKIEIYSRKKILYPVPINFSFYKILNVEEAEKYNVNKLINWDNLKEIRDKYDLPFKIVEKNKGLQLIYNSGFDGRVSFYQWKENINILFFQKAKKINYSIEDILKYSDGETAIKFLKEKGIFTIK